MSMFWNSMGEEEEKGNKSNKNRFEILQLFGC